MIVHGGEMRSSVLAVLSVTYTLMKGSGLLIDLSVGCEC